MAIFTVLFTRNAGRTITLTSIQNRTLLSGAHPGSALKVNFHHLANDTLPLVFHTERHGRLICTREETVAVRLRVLRVVTPKTGRPRRIQGSPSCPQRVVSWSQGMGKNLQRSRVSKIPHTPGNPGPSMWEPSE